MIRVIHKRSLSSSVLETIRPISQNQLKIDRLITFTQSVSEKIICHQQYYYIVCNGEFEPKKVIIVNVCFYLGSFPHTFFPVFFSHSITEVNIFAFLTAYLFHYSSFSFCFSLLGNDDDDDKQTEFKNENENKKNT